MSIVASAVYVWGESIFGISMLSAWFYCESKSVIKNNLLKIALCTKPNTIFADSRADYGLCPLIWRYSLQIFFYFTNIWNSYVIRNTENSTACYLCCFRIDCDFLINFWCFWRHGYYLFAFLRPNVVSNA